MKIILIIFSPNKYEKDIEKLNSMLDDLENLKDGKKKNHLKLQSQASGIADIGYIIQSLGLNKKKFTKVFNRAGFTGYEIGNTDYLSIDYEASEIYGYQTLQESINKSLKSILNIRPFHSKTDDGVVGQIAIAMLGQNILGTMNEYSVDITSDSLTEKLESLRGTKKGVEILKKTYRYSKPR